MAETYSFCTRVGATGEIKQRAWENSFGDGYVQSGGTGINTQSQEWSHQVLGRMAPGSELRLIKEFLDRHEGYKSFFWTPPEGVQGRYKVNGYNLDPQGADVYRLTFSMKQVFTPY